MTPHKDSRVKVSVLLRVRHKVSEVANLVGVSRTTVYAMKKSMDDGEGVNSVQAVIERLLRIVTACLMPFEGLLLLRDVIRGTIVF